MKIKRYCFFGGLLQMQENWLNRMAKEGYRLVKVGKLWYEFEESQAKEYEYRLEFIASKPQKDVQDYVTFLNDLGYRTFFKNINCNYAIGKVRYRPWAEKGAKIATRANTFDKELLIIEKEKDEKPFELFSTWEDKINYYKNMQKPYLTIAVFLLLLGIFSRNYPAVIPSFVALLPVGMYQYQMEKIKKESKIREW